MSVAQLSGELNRLGVVIDLGKLLNQGPEALLTEVDRQTRGKHDLAELIQQACDHYDQMIAESLD